MFYRAFFCLRPPATLLATRFYATRTAFLCQRAKPATLFLLLLCHTLSHTLLRSMLNHQAKCASHAFFCSHAHAPSHLNATRQIPCHTLSRAFLRHACHAFFVSFAFFILNSAQILKNIFEILKFKDF